jgi:peptide/nickel transport system permease protein
MAAIASPVGRFLASELVHNYRRNASAIAGSAIILGFAFTVTIGPWLVAQDPYDISQLELMDSFKPPAWLEGASTA